MYHPSARQPEVEKNRMTVFGSGRVSVEPNAAILQLGVVTQDQALTTAQQNNAQIIHQVLQSFANLGVSQENIQTSDYAVYPQYDYVDGAQQFKGYQVTHMLTVTIDTINQTGLIIDTAVQHGANRIASISFSVRDESLYYQQALQIALDNARVKAQTIAQSMGLHLNPTPIIIDEQTIKSTTIPYQTFASTEVAGVSTDIEPGQLEIEAKVEVTFSYS